METILLKNTIVRKEMLYIYYWHAVLFIKRLFMIDRNIDLNYVYGWNYHMLKFMGIWPEERKWTRPSSYHVLLPFIMMVVFACAPQTINLLLIAGNSNLVIENLSTNITTTISLMKAMAVWIKGKRKHFRKLTSKDLSCFFSVRILPNINYINLILLFYIIIFYYLSTFYSTIFFNHIPIVKQNGLSRRTLSAIFSYYKH